MADQEELTKDEIEAQVRAAFAPNYCAVQVKFRARLWCEVLDKNQKSLSQTFTIDELGDYRTQATLGKVLQQWREILGNDGYEFDSGGS